jgi:hypothetical protein
MTHRLLNFQQQNHYFITNPQSIEIYLRESIIYKLHFHPFKISIDEKNNLTTQLILKYKKD